MHPFSRLLTPLLKLRPFLLALLGGVLLTALLATWAGKLIQRNAQTLLEQAVGVATLRIEARLNEQTEMLRGLQGAFIANPGLERETFQAILEEQNILSRLSGFVAIGFARQIERENLKPFVAAVRRGRRNNPAPYQDYTVHPDTGLARTQPIDYLYPVNISTARYLGLDLLSFTDNRSALILSRDEGRGMASIPFRLGPQGNAPLGFMMHFPVYAGPKPLNIVERQARYRGSITAIYQVDQILASMGSALQNPYAQTRLFDTGGALDRAARHPETLLYEASQPSNNPGALLCSNKLINLPGRQWRLELCATTWQIVPQHHDSLRLYWLTGIGLSLIVATLLQVKKQAAAREEHEERERNAGLRQRENHWQKLSALAEQMNELIVIRDVLGRIEYANPVAQRRFGREDKPLEQSAEPLLLSAELGQLNEPLNATSSHCDAEGRVNHYQASVIPLHTLTDHFLGTALLARDITIETEQGEALRQRNERLSDLLELSNDWIWEQDTAGHFTHISGGFFKIHDINPAHQTELSPRELAQAGLSEAQWLVHRKAIETRQSYRDFTFILRSGNAPLVISLSGKPVFDAAGYFVGYRGVGRDITALHQARLMAQAEKQRLAAVLESLSDGVITTDLSGRVDYINPVAIALTGREPQEAISQPIELIFQVIDPTTRLPLPSLPRQTLATHQAPARHRNSILLNRFGPTFNIQEAVACIRDEKGDACGCVVVFRDQSNWPDRVNFPV